MNFDEMSEDEQKALHDELVVLTLRVEVAVLRETILAILENKNPTPIGQKPRDFLFAQIEKSIDDILRGGADFSPEYASKLAMLRQRLKDGYYRNPSNFGSESNDS